MLVLSRKENEEIEIEGGITITVVSICGGKVRLGITAPRNLFIHRGEILQRIEARRDAEAVGAATEEATL